MFLTMSAEAIPEGVARNGRKATMPAIGKVLWAIPAPPHPELPKLHTASLI
jgi:hypothetical protein